MWQRHGTVLQQPSGHGGQICGRALAGYQKVHLLACLKHFPGLGKGKEDTHKGQVIVSADRETLLREDGLPFRLALEKYPEPWFGVMVTHVRYPALDPDYPASLSPKSWGICSGASSISPGLCSPMT